MEQEKGPIIEMIDNNGNKIKAEIYEIFDFEDKKYALLLPLIEDNQEEVNSLAVMSLLQDGDQYYIQEIESDLEYARVVEYLQGPYQEGHHCHCGCEDHDCGCGDHDHDCGCGCGEEHHHDHDHHCHCGCED